MPSFEIENDPAGACLPEADLVAALSRLCAWTRVQAHALGVPALANLLMQGLVC